MKVQHLLTRVRSRGSGSRRPRQTDLRRQVSDTYYAAFHALCGLNADILIGTKKRLSDEWVRAYRALDHGVAKNVLKLRDAQNLDPAIQQFAALFIGLQEDRHKADYDPRPFPRRQLQVRNLGQQAETAIANLNALSTDKKLALATRLLFKDRQQ